MTKMNIKTGDTVKVIAGKDKGAQGEVLFAFPEKGRVTVQGVNLLHKALRPTQANPNGGIDTVSYTHLDVYKRQGVIYRTLCIFGAVCLTPGANLTCKGSRLEAAIR